MCFFLEVCLGPRGLLQQPRTGRFKQRDLFLMVLEMEVQDGGASRVCVWLEFCAWVADSHLLTASSHGRVCRPSSIASSPVSPPIRTLVPSWEPYCHLSLFISQRLPIQVPSQRGLGFQHSNLGVGHSSRALEVVSPTPLAPESLPSWTSL